MEFKDSKYLCAFLLPTIFFLTCNMGGYWNWAVPVFAFGFIPILEMFLPQDKSNFTPEEEANRNASKLFDFLLYLNLPIIYMVAAVALYLIARVPLTTGEAAGLVVSAGLILSSNGINVAHEIGHRPSFFDQTISRLILLPCLYMHFNIEHNLGHHKNVATPEDPASAQLGENFYGFLPKTLFGGFMSAWRIEKKILNKKQLGTWSIQNRMLQFILVQTIYLAIIFGVWGLKLMLYAVAIGLISSIMLEAINYVEHYGLQRKKLPNGKYEPVQSHHSWNSDHTLGRIMLYELTRHSDHHFKSTRKFQILRTHKESPELPLGYPGSILLSMFPPLWFMVMNPRVKKVMN